MAKNEEIDKILKAAGRESNPELEQKEEYVNQDALNTMNAQLKRIEEFEDRTIEAGALGAARGLSFGLTDQALVKSGIYTPEEKLELLQPPLSEQVEQEQ
jgi:histidinol dehydrogenase